jgi:hypothetical protein
MWEALKRALQRETIFNIGYKPAPLPTDPVQLQQLQLEELRNIRSRTGWLIFLSLLH